MSKKFNCPACGSPMEYDGQTTLFQNCGSCGAPIVVPAEIVQTSRDNKIESMLNMPAPEEIPTEEVLEIKQLANQGRKIEAIKLHRETFGSDLAEAKRAVEDMTSGANANRPDQTVSVDANESLRMVRNELNAGNKINAIKIFRETFNTSLRDAKDAVDAMEMGHEIDISKFL
ncbi:MAG: hypothetical protein R2747_14535 [Pyrinomonadaceae bacterium]